MKQMSARKKRRVEKTLLRNRRYKVIIYNRVILTMLLFLLQIAAYAVLTLYLYNTGKTAAVIIVNVLAILFVLGIINRHENPSSKLNWIIIILIAPVFGVPLYLTVGEGRPTRRMHKKIAEAKEKNSAALEQSEAALRALEASGRDGETSKYLLGYAHYPVYSDGDVEYFDSGKALFEKMLEAVDAAKEFIFVEYFIIAGGKMWSALCTKLLEKAEQGVQVRIIFDDGGSVLVLPPKYDRYLNALHPNIKCLCFNRVPPVFSMRLNNRDHRKIFVADGKVAFTGGINIADEYIGEKERFGEWKDSGIRITGSAVDSFTVMFLNLWNAFSKEKLTATEYVKKTASPIREGLIIHPYDDSPLDKENVGESVYLDLINRASEYLYIFTPYLILDDFMRTAIRNAAKRGVDVRIVTPGIPDKKLVFRLTRSNYLPLLKAGVKIYEYSRGFIHAKSMVMDDKAAVVGTINLDYRSLYLHFEDAVYFSGCSAVGDVKKDSEAVFACSKEISFEDTNRTFLGKLVDSVLRVFETLV